MAGDDSEVSDQRRYDAFISYSHSADGELAPALQSAVQRLAKPWRKRRALEVFRDQTGLSANPALWTSIVTALDDSKWFVLLSSPAAAQSEWVGKEIQHWVQRRGASSILPVVTEGTWVWDTARNDFDRARSTAVHPALFGVFSEEPRFIDLSWARSETDLTLKNARFRDQVAEIAAPLHGMTKDALEGEDVRQQRRTIRLARGAVAGLALLTVAALVAGGLAVASQRDAARQRDAAEASAVEAQRQRDIAEANAEEAQRQQAIAQEQARSAASRLLASTQETSPDGALQYLLTAQAYRMSPTVQAQAAVLRLAPSGLGRRMLGFEGGVVAAEFGPTGTNVATVDGVGTAQLWNLVSGGPGRPITTNAVDVDFVSAAELVVATGSGVQWYDVSTGALLGERTDLPSAPVHISALPDGSVVVGAAAGEVLVVGRVGEMVELSPRPEEGLQVAITFIGTSDDGGRIVSARLDRASGQSRLVTVWDATFAQVGTWQSPHEVRDVSPDGSLVATVLVAHSTWGTDHLTEAVDDGRGLLATTRRTDDGAEVATLSSIQRFAARDAAFVAGSEQLRVVTTNGVDGAPGLGWFGSPRAPTAQDAESDRSSTRAESDAVGVESALLTVVSPDGSVAFTGGAGSEATVLEIGGFSAFFAGRVLPQGLQTVFPISTAPDAGLLVATNGTSIGVWDMTAEVFWALLPDDGRPATISPDGSLLVSFGGQVFDIATGALRSFVIEPIDPSALPMWSPSGRLAYVAIDPAGAGAGRVVVADPATGTTFAADIELTPCPFALCSALAISADGETVVIRESADEAGLSTITAFAVGDALAQLASATFVGGGPLVFDPGSDQLLVAADGLVHRLAAETLDVAGESAVLVLFRDEQWLARPGSSNVLQIDHCSMVIRDSVTWSVLMRTGDLATFGEGGCEERISGAWLSGGRFISTTDVCDPDCAGRVWATDAAAAVPRLCAYAGRNMTETEWNQYLPGFEYEVTCEEFPDPTNSSAGGAARAALADHLVGTDIGPGAAVDCAAGVSDQPFCLRMLPQSRVLEVAVVFGAAGEYVAMYRVGLIRGLWRVTESVQSGALPEWAAAALEDAGLPAPAWAEGPADAPAAPALTPTLSPATPASPATTVSTTPTTATAVAGSVAVLSRSPNGIAGPQVLSALGVT